MLEQKDIDKQFKKILSKVKNYHDAEDILSDALLEFYKLQSKVEITKPKQLFNKTVYFKIKDYYKNKHSNKVEKLKDYEVSIDKDEDLYFLDLQSSLSEEEYEIMVLHYAYGYNYDYICKMFKLRRGKLARILRRIKTEIVTNL